MRAPSRLARPTRTATGRFVLGYLLALVGFAAVFAAMWLWRDLGAFAALVHVGLGMIGLAAAMIDPRFRGLVAAWLGVTTVLVLVLVALSSDPDVGLIVMAPESALYFAWPMIIGFAVGSRVRQWFGLPSGWLAAGEPTIGFMPRPRRSRTDFPNPPPARGRTSGPTS